MKKIKITTNTDIKSSKKFKNIAMNYGISYYSIEENKIKTITKKNSWNMRILAKFDKINNYFKKPESFNQVVLDEIAEYTNFIAQYEIGVDRKLEIQLNVNTKLHNIILGLAKPFKKRNLTQTANIDNIMLKHNRGDYFIIIGMDYFKKENKDLDFLTKSLSLKELVSHIFLHEYSHMLKFSNSKKYDMRKKKANQIIGIKDIKTYKLDRLWGNLEHLYKNQYIDLLQIYLNNKNKEAGTEEILNFPNVDKTLWTLHNEMYADVGGVLLKRNKDLQEGVFSQSKTINLAQSISDIRKVVKEQHTQEYKDEIIIFYHDHLTSPALESLIDVLKKLEEKQLPMEDIYNVTMFCVKEGIAKTLFAYHHTNELIRKELQLLLEFNYSEESIFLTVNKKPRNHYEEMICEIKEIVPKDWQENFIKNLDKLPKNYYENKAISVFNAALDKKAFENDLLKIFIDEQIEDNINKKKFP